MWIIMPERHLELLKTPYFRQTIARHVRLSDARPKLNHFYPFDSSSWIDSNKEFQYFKEQRGWVMVMGMHWIVRRKHFKWTLFMFVFAVCIVDLIQCCSARIHTYTRSTGALQSGMGHIHDTTMRKSVYLFILLHISNYRHVYTWNLLHARSITIRSIPARL